MENVDFNGMGAGILVVFQGFFDADSSFGVTNGFALSERKKNDFKYIKLSTYVGCSVGGFSTGLLVFIS
jgi:hypothetical protein